LRSDVTAPTQQRHAGELTVVAYDDTRREAWDGFVDRSKNGTFLFRRSYMEYHAERFPDASLLVYDAREQLLALLPASPRGSTLSSHPGLTYGGFVLDERMTLPTMLMVFDALGRHLLGTGQTALEYKTIPHIYHSVPAEEDRYCLFRMDAQLVRRDVLTVIDLARRPELHTQRRRALRRAHAAELEVRHSQDYEQFWPILTDNLAQRHGLAPVHSLDEIRLLAGRFPQEISLIGAFRDQEMLAGAVLYLSPAVCHVQYNAATEEGRAVGALDVVLEDLVTREALGRRFLDFGVSTEEEGRVLNTGLVSYKEGFGGRTVAHDFHRWDVGVAPA
jgi:hypothetical protein